MLRKFFYYSYTNLPYIERNRHNGVKNDNVWEEHKKADDCGPFNSATIFGP